MKKRGRLRAALATVVLVLLATSVVPGSANLKEELERLRQQQEQVKQERASKAAQVDAATAEADVLADALATLSGQVNAQAAAVADAEQRLAAAQTQHDAAIQAVLVKTAEIDVLKARVQEAAISSFVSRDDPRSPLFEEGDPSRAVRMRSLAQSVSESGITVAEQLRAAQEDLRIEEAAAEAASAEAEQIKGELAEELAELERRRGEQQAMVEAAEERLERQLAEAAALAELDQEYSNKIVATNAELARQQAAAARRRNNPAPSSSSVGFPSAADIVNVRGFWVHKDIAQNFDAMMGAAEAAGHRFGGGAYRDHSNQIRLRKAHCGSSNYAIYQMPASQCRPPTARPGQSMHEQGKAIDFTYNGSIISSRSSAGFKWLDANAARYGFYNLPSEPWHWSVNGK